MIATEEAGLELQASDVSGQKLFNVRRIPAESTVGDLIDGLLPKMNMPRNDPEGRPLTYYALHDREGRHLQVTERVGDALQNGDKVVLQPNIDAGARG